MLTSKPILDKKGKQEKFHEKVEKGETEEVKKEDKKMNHRSKELKQRLKSFNHNLVEGKDSVHSIRKSASL